ncbi:hypothetical protein O6R05_02590 [Peptoniphilus equinus]|uniref:N-acetyltransferase domain-containing protein n=1 Tax=Peptoniphilus equinus TaxID=3016343 RepID=A0ABY7QUH8_9FIRM|nr:hypothetical protein [Peptoniphilus equinus]WBW50449.1 hypothetical protein O6R05_02590 [Peptoniphilus equinus]
MNNLTQDSFNFRKLKPEDAPQLIALVEDVYSRIDQKHIFVRDDLEYIEKTLKDGGRGLGVYLDDELVGFRYVTITPREDSLVAYTDIKTDAKHVVNLDTVLLHEKARGFGFQNKLRTMMLEELMADGYHVYASTISPDNEISFANSINAGTHLVALKHVYPSEQFPEGVLRFIFFRDFQRDFEFTDETAEAAPGEHDTIHELLDKGYVGVSYSDGKIKFQKRRC